MSGLRTHAVWDMQPLGRPATAPPRDVPLRTHYPCPTLAADYTVFGKVLDGWDALAAIERVPCNEKHRPLAEVRLESITIHANPLADQMIVFPTATGPPDIQT